MDAISYPTAAGEAEAKTSARPIIAVVGPTASGKSDLGIALALRFGGEIVNADSVQIYRDIEIATAKVPFAERRGVPHHLLDFVPPAAKYTAGDWARDAERVIGAIESRGRPAFVVGGSNFYLRALRRPLFESPPTDADVRRRLVERRERRGARSLHRILRRLDPETAARLPERDWSRVQRALEFRLQTGQTFARAQRAHQTAVAAAPISPLAARLHLFALNPPRDALYERINRRAEAHFARGLIEEVEDLLRRGAPASSSALGAHGYRRAVEFLTGRRASRASAIEQTKLDVRHYAKRQLTWLRGESPVTWFEGFGDDARVQEQALRAALALFGGVE